MIHWSGLIISGVVLIVLVYIITLIGSILDTLERQEKMINSIRTSRLDQIVAPETGLD